MSSQKPLHELVADYVRHSTGNPSPPSRIAVGLIEANPERFTTKLAGFGGDKGSLADQLTREIYAQWRLITEKHPDIAVDKSKSPMVFLNSPGNGAKVEPGVETEERDEPDSTSDELSEFDLYPAIRDFLAIERSMVSKRIRESTSSNRRGRNGNKWLHPDIVAMEPIGQKWLSEVRGGAGLLQAKRCRLISIEAKLALTAGNLRQSFFQTTSNSLWANEAYLASRDIVGAEPLDELEMLCELHGVGYLQVDPHTPSNSRILIPARRRAEIDWASVNRIAAENADFREFVGNVHNFLQTGQLLKPLWA